MAARVITTLVAVLLLGGCGAPAAPAGATVERDTVGDTVIVRTLSGSEWGEGAVLEPELRVGVFEGEDHYMFGEIRSIGVARDGAMYVMDAHVPALRKYAPDGRYVGTFGREGEGPGEYRGPDGGLAVLDDGRVVLRDPRNARLQVYGPSGPPQASPSIPTPFSTATVSRRLCATPSMSNISLVSASGGRTHRGAPDRFPATH